MTTTTSASMRITSWEVATVLAGARQLLSDPRRWLQGKMRNPKRTCFCAYGAVLEVAGTRSVVGFNDDPKTKHGDVLALFDRAIEAVSA